MTTETNKKSRGKVKGTKQGPSKGSIMEWLSRFECGHREYVETTVDRAHDDCRRLVNSVKMKAHDCLKDKFFTTTILTATSSRSIKDVRYLICIERTV